MPGAIKGNIAKKQIQGLDQNRLSKTLRGVKKDVELKKNVINVKRIETPWKSNNQVKVSEAAGEKRATTRKSSIQKRRTAKRKILLIETFGIRNTPQPKYRSFVRDVHVQDDWYGERLLNALQKSVDDNELDITKRLTSKSPEFEKRSKMLHHFRHMLEKDRQAQEEKKKACCQNMHNSGKRTSVSHKTTKQQRRPNSKVPKCQCIDSFNDSKFIVSKFKDNHTPIPDMRYVYPYPARRSATSKNKYNDAIVAAAKNMGWCKSLDNDKQIPSTQPSALPNATDRIDINVMGLNKNGQTPEHVKDIYAYLHHLEKEDPIRVNHMESQEQLLPYMRGVLIDWICEIHFTFNLATETLHLTVAIIDRYLQKVSHTKHQELQVLGLTALFMSAKYEDDSPLDLDKYVVVTGDMDTAKQITDMELNIMKTLNDNLIFALPIHFLRRYSKVVKFGDIAYNMTKYFIELSLVEYEMAPVKPSELAAAAIFLTLHFFTNETMIPSGFNNNLWDVTLEWYSGYSANYLRPVAQKMALLARKAPETTLKSVNKKFQSPEFRNISERPELRSQLIDSIAGISKVKKRKQTEITGTVDSRLHNPLEAIKWAYSRGSWL